MAAAAHNNLFMWLDGDGHMENDDDNDCYDDDHDNDVVFVVMKSLNGRLLHSITFHSIP